MDPLNGPYTQCKNGHQREFKYSFFTLKRAWLTMFSRKKFKRINVVFKSDLNVNKRILN